MRVLALVSICYCIFSCLFFGVRFSLPPLSSSAVSFFWAGLVLIRCLCVFCRRTAHVDAGHAGYVDLSHETCGIEAEDIGYEMR